MSLAKLLSLITTSTIYFSQLSALRKLDPYEGSQTLSTRAFYTMMQTNETFARSFMGISEDQPLPANYHDFFHLGQAKLLNDIHASTFYVNCWHISEHESAFLWSVYSSLSDGVCVQSNIGRLKKCIDGAERDVSIGPVRYIDYVKDHIPSDNSFNVVYRKRKSFEAERELRLSFLELLPGVGWGPSALTQNPAGVALRCDLAALIDQIRLSPSAPDWYRATISAVVDRLGHKFPVLKSEISSPAIF